MYAEREGIDDDPTCTRAVEIANAFEQSDELCQTLEQIDETIARENEIHNRNTANGTANAEERLDDAANDKKAEASMLLKAKLQQVHQLVAEAMRLQRICAELEHKSDRVRSTPPSGQGDQPRDIEQDNVSAEARGPFPDAEFVDSVQTFYANTATTCVLNALGEGESLHDVAQSIYQAASEANASVIAYFAPLYSVSGLYGGSVPDSCVGNHGNSSEPSGLGLHRHTGTSTMRSTDRLLDVVCSEIRNKWDVVVYNLPKFLRATSRTQKVAASSMHALIPFLQRVFLWRFVRGDMCYGRVDTQETSFSDDACCNVDAHTNKHGGACRSVGACTGLSLYWSWRTDTFAYDPATMDIVDRALNTPVQIDHPCVVLLPGLIGEYPSKGPSPHATEQTVLIKALALPCDYVTSGVENPQSSATHTDDKVRQSAHSPFDTHSYGQDTTCTVKQSEAVRGSGCACVSDSARYRETGDTDSDTQVTGSEPGIVTDGVDGERMTEGIPARNNEPVSSAVPSSYSECNESGAITIHTTHTTAGTPAGGGHTPAQHHPQPPTGTHSAQCASHTDREPGKPHTVTHRDSESSAELMDAEQSTHSPRGSPATTEDTHKSDKCTSYESLTIESTPADSQNAEAVCGSLSDTATIDSHMSRRQIAVGVNISSIDVNVSAGASSLSDVVRLDECAPPTAVASDGDGHANTSAQTVSSVLESSNTPPTSLAQQQESWRCGGPSAENRASLKVSPLTNHPVSARHLTEQYIQSHELNTKPDETVAGQPHDTSHHQITTNTPADTVSPRTCSSAANVWTQQCQTRSHLPVMRRRYAQRRSQDIVVYDELGRSILTHAVGGDSGARVLVCEPIRVPPQATMADDCASINRPAAEAGSGTGNRDVYRDGVEACTTPVDDRSVGVTATSPGTMKGTSVCAADRETSLYEGATDRGPPLYEGAMHGDGMEGGTVHVDGPINGPESGPKSSTRMGEQSAVNYTQGDQSITATGTSMDEQSAAEYTQGDQSIKATGTSMGEQSAVDLEMQMDALEHAVACKEELLSGEEELAVEALETMATVCRSPLKEGAAKGSAESPVVSTSDSGLTLDTEDDEPSLLATEVEGGDIADTPVLQEMETGIGSLSATPLADSSPKSLLQTAIGEVASAAAAYECVRVSVRLLISPHQIAVTPPDTTQTETGHTNTTTLASAWRCDGSSIADEKHDGADGRPSPGCVRNSSQWSQESVAGSHACGCADCAVCSDGREREALHSAPTLHAVFRIASKLLSDVQDTRDGTEYHTVSSECGVERVSDGTRDTTTPIHTTEPNTAAKELGRNVVDPHLASSSPDAKHQEPHDSETEDASSKCASMGDGRSPMEGAVEHTEFDTPTDDPKGITCPSEVSAATSGAMPVQDTAVKSQSVVDEGNIPTVLAGADASGERGVQLEGDPISQRHNRDDTNTAQHAPKIERLPDASTVAERGGSSEGSHRDGRRYGHARINPTEGSVDAYGYGGVTVHARSDSVLDTGQPNDEYTACSNRKRMRGEADAQPLPGRTTRNKSNDKALERGEGLSPMGGGMGLSTQGVDKDTRVGVQDASLADLGLVAVPKCTGEHLLHAKAATPSQRVTTERSPVISELATVDERKEERGASCDIVSQSTGDTPCVALDGPHTLTSEKDVRLDGLKEDAPQHTVTAGQGQNTNGDTLCRDETDLVHDVTTRTGDVYRTEGGAHNTFGLCSLTQLGKVRGEIASDTTLEVEGKEHDTSLTSKPLTTSASKTKAKPKSTPNLRPKSKQKSKPKTKPKSQSKPKPKPKARTNPKPTFTSESNTKFKFDEFLWQSGPYTRSQAASEHDRSPAAKATHTPEVQSTSQQGRRRGDSTYGKKGGRQKKGCTRPTNDNTPQQPTETLNTQPQKASTTNTAHRRKRAYTSDMDADVEGKETQPQKRTKQAKQAKQAMQATAKGEAATDPEQTYGHATVPKTVESICEQTSVETDGVVTEMGTQPADTSSAATDTSTHTLAETDKRGKSGKVNPRVSAKARTGQAVKTATPAHAKVSSHRPEGDRRVSKSMKCHTLDTQGVSQALTTDTVHGTQPCRLKVIGPRAQSLEEAQEDAVMSGSGDTAGAKATVTVVGLSVCETEEHKGVRQSVDSTDPDHMSGAEVQRVTGHTVGEDEGEIQCGEIIGLGRVSATGIHADETTGAHAGTTRVHTQQIAHTPPLTQSEHAADALSTQNTPQTTQTPETPYVSQTPQTQFTEHARQRGHTPQVEQMSESPHVPQAAQALHAVQTAHTPQTGQPSESVCTPQTLPATRTTHTLQSAETTPTQPTLHQQAPLTLPKGNILPPGNTPTAEHTQQSAPTPSTGHTYKAAQIAHTKPFKPQPQTTSTVHTGEPKHSLQTAQTLPKEHARGYAGLFGGHRRRTVTTRKQTQDQLSLEGTEHAHGADGACDSSQTHLQGVGASVLSYPQSALGGNVGRRKSGAKVDADVAKHLFEDKYSDH